ncbi:MAG: amidophosphoribosyltransferase [Bacteroidetes bacterium]|nr:amidophosphoribosyltransferase [Bacteroidota bacterium]
MSELIKHECGIALVRLLKPLEYYLAEYGTPFYGLNKLHLMMQKQHNRGQDGAGMACIKFDLEPGNKYINRIRSNSVSPIQDVFKKAYKPLFKMSAKHPERANDVQWLKKHMEFTGELFLGHLRYGTFGANKIENLHPMIRFNNWMTKSLVLAGNFNMTNVDELFNLLIDLGQYPVETSDTVTIMEKIGNFLDQENEKLYQQFKEEGLDKRDISPRIAKSLDILQILIKSSQLWDGGFAIAGMLGHGDAFVMRDPSGIRPAFYYADEEVVVAASERPVIQTSFNVSEDNVKELKPGYVLIIRKDGRVTELEYRKPLEKKACSFERIYFSRGTDSDIYRERKNLGRALVPAVMEAIDNDFLNTVFSYIPNTASSAFRGMINGLHDLCDEIKREKISRIDPLKEAEKLKEILAIRPRVDNIAVKDIKLRTFITQDSQRDDLVGHVYDITYGVIRPGIDNLLVIDDSIVRGTTLKQSIIRILARLEPKNIIIASSAPQIRYPDCYGIDMARIGDFIAFRAAIELLKDSAQQHIMNEVYNKSKAQQHLPKEEIVNYVKEIYKPFSAQQISDKIAELLRPAGLKPGLKIIYQSIEDLHSAIPDHTGDWYFTGNYPTPGGNKVVNLSYIQFIEGSNKRAY